MPEAILNRPYVIGLGIVVLLVVFLIGNFYNPHEEQEKVEKVCIGGIVYEQTWTRPGDRLRLEVSPKYNETSLTIPCESK